jgi:hypothetical protein
MFKKLFAFLLLAAAVTTAFALEEVKSVLQDTYLWQVYSYPDDTTFAKGDSIYSPWISSTGGLSTNTLSWAFGAVDSAAWEIQFCFRTLQITTTLKRPDSANATPFFPFYKIVAANADTNGFWPLANFSYLGTPTGWIYCAWHRWKLKNLDQTDSLKCKWAQEDGAGLP